MPLSFHPLLRSNQQARETAGLIKALDSVGLTRRKAEETAGTKVKDFPKQTYIFVGTRYTPTATS